MRNMLIQMKARSDLRASNDLSCLQIVVVRARKSTLVNLGHSETRLPEDGARFFSYSTFHKSSDQDTSPRSVF